MIRQLFQLEQRQLFDGAAFASIAQESASDLSDSTPQSDLASGKLCVDSTITENCTAAISFSSAPKELLVIDASVSDWQLLLEGIAPNVTVLLIEAHDDGIQKISEALQQTTEEGRYAAVHIVSHGQEAQFKLGNRLVNAQTLNDSRDAFSRIGQGLLEGGDILLYGCDIASGETGLNFIQSLSNATSRDIAASSNKTGRNTDANNAHISDADWWLEQESGDVADDYTVSAAFRANLNFQQVLPNLAPDAVSDNRNLLSSQIVTTGEAILGNAFGDNRDSDPDGDSFVVAGIASGSQLGPILSGVNTVITGQYGNLIISEGGQYTYTLNANGTGLIAGQSGIEVFTYTICDSWNNVDTAYITFAIYGDRPPINLPPNAVADIRAICESEVIRNGQATAGNALGDNRDSDPNNEPIFVTGVRTGNFVSGPALNTGLTTPILGQFGTLVMTGSDGSYTYTPNAAAIALFAGQSGTDVFTYSIADAQGASSNTTISVTVCGEGAPVNLPPVANADNRTMCEDDAPLNGQAILGSNSGDARDTDPDGDSLLIQGVAAGSSALTPIGNVGTAINGQWGTLVLQSDGSYTYTPGAQAQALKPTQSVNDVFTYAVSDNKGGTSTTTITINICGENDPPVAKPDARVVCEDDVLNDGQAILGNVRGDIADMDPENDTLTMIDVRSGSVANVGGAPNNMNAVTGACGTITVSENGNYIYRPNQAAQALSEGETVTDTFTYTVRDSAGLTSSSTITINVCGQNDAPTAQDDKRAVTPTSVLTNGSAVQGNALGDTADTDKDRRDNLIVVGVRAGAEDPNCLPQVTGGVRATALEQANVNKPIEGTYGTLTLKPDGTYSYQPNAAALALSVGQRVLDVFTYSVSDGQGGSDCAQITICLDGTAQPKSDPPVVTPPAVTPPTVTTPEPPPIIVTPPRTFAPPVTPVTAIPLILPLVTKSAPLNLGSAVIPETVGALITSPFSEAPRAVKSAVVEAPVVEDCVPLTKPAKLDAKGEKRADLKVKPKIKPSIFAGLVDKPETTNKGFSEQIKLATKRLKLPPKVAPRVVEKDC